MPRFGFVGDEEMLEQKMMANTPQREHLVLVEKEATRQVDVDLTKETSDKAAYAEGKEKAVGSTVRAPVAGSKEHQYLLDEVATNWKTGKGSHQTEHCTSAIRICLLEGMKPVTIANYVVHNGVSVGEQGAERKRVQDCASYINRKLGLNINRSLKKSGEGASNDAAVSDRGDTLQNAIERGMSSLSISSKEKENKASVRTLFNKVENEHHWRFMWIDAKTELKELRENLRGETDEKVKKELMADIKGLEKKTDEWAALLGMKV